MEGKLNHYNSKTPSKVIKVSEDVTELKQTIRMMIIGKEYVGKTSILEKFVKNQFWEVYITTIGVDFRSFNVQQNDEFFKVQIWDAAGMERFKDIVQAYFKDLNIVLLVYDITDLQTFYAIKDYHKEMLDAKQSHNNAQFVVIGNKNDMEEDRKVTIQMGRGLGDELNCLFFETSAKSGYGITESILFSIQKYLLEKNK